MKKSSRIFSITFIVAVFLFLFNSCNCIQGEGPIVSENRNLSNFDGIELNIAARVYLEKSDTFRFRVEAQENVLKELETFVVSGLLRIRYNQMCVNSRRNVRIYISMPKLSEVEIGGSGKLISSEVFECDNLKLKISGSGDIEIAAIAKEIECTISGSGGIELSGTTENLDAYIRGSGSLYALRMQSYNVYVSVRGSGNSRVYASEYLKADISGSGDVLYKGQPAIDTNIKGSGNVRRIK